MTHSVARPHKASFKSSHARLAAAVVALVASTAWPASAQRAPDDTRPGGVEVRPSAPPAPAGADMSAPPSMLFRKPALTPPVLPTPAPAAAAMPVPPPPAPPPATVPAAEKPASPPATAPATVPPGKAEPAKPDAKKKATAPPPTGATRSFRYEAPAPGAPAGAASDGAPAPSGKMGDDRLPGGVERAPTRE